LRNDLNNVDTERRRLFSLVSSVRCTVLSRESVVHSGNVAVCQLTEGGSMLQQPDTECDTQHLLTLSLLDTEHTFNKNSSEDEIANVNFYAVHPEAT